MATYVAPAKAMFAGPHFWQGRKTATPAIQNNMPIWLIVTTRRNRPEIAFVAPSNPVEKRGVPDIRRQPDMAAIQIGGSRRDFRILKAKHARPRPVPTKSVSLKLANQIATLRIMGGRHA